MYSERTLLRLNDVVYFSDLALEYVGVASAAQFAKDRKSALAVERCLQCVTEAIIQIGEEDFSVVAPTAELDRIRGMGNMLRHEYRRIDPSIIYQTVIDDLPPLRAACQRALESL